MSVFTNSLMNLDILYPVCDVNMIGGLYRDERKDFSGYMSELALKDLHFDYCIVGADAVSLERGILAMDIETVRFDRDLMSRSDCMIVLAHSAKLYRNSLLSFAPVESVSHIVTDTGVDDALFQQYQNKGIKISRVQQKKSTTGNGTTEKLSIRCASSLMRKRLTCRSSIRS